MVEVRERFRDIQTVSAMRAAITTANTIYLHVQLGCMARMVQLSKREARDLFQGLEASKSGISLKFRNGTIGFLDEAGDLHINAVHE